MDARREPGEPGVRRGRGPDAVPAGARGVPHPVQGVFDPSTGRDRTGGFVAETWQELDERVAGLVSDAITSVRAGEDPEDVWRRIEDDLRWQQERAANSLKRPFEAFEQERFAPQRDRARASILAERRP